MTTAPPTCSPMRGRGWVSCLHWTAERGRGRELCPLWPLVAGDSEWVWPAAMCRWMEAVLPSVDVDTIILVRY